MGALISRFAGDQDAGPASRALGWPTTQSFFFHQLTEAARYRRKSCAWRASSSGLGLRPKDASMDLACMGAGGGAGSITPKPAGTRAPWHYALLAFPSLE